MIALRRAHVRTEPLSPLVLVIAVGLFFWSCSGQSPAEGPQSDAAATANDADLRCEGDTCQGCLGATDGDPCDDGDTCTKSDACAAGTCVGQPACACKIDEDCTPLEDGDACNGTLYCDAQAAKPTCKVNPGTIVACPPDQPCSASVCQPATGKCSPTHATSTTSCDDGTPCTVSACDGKGACAATGQDPLCTCQDDSDCAPLDDNDLCNGSLFCDKTAAAWTCKANTAAAVVCPLPSAPCHNVTCTPATGVCIERADLDGTPCDDGKVCTTGDVCVAAACHPGTLTCPCKSHAECAAQDDGDLCNGVPYCDSATGKCTANAASAVICPASSDTFCSKSACQPSTGKCALTPVSEAVACDDGDPCSLGERCTAGVCGGGLQTCECKIDTDCDSKDDGDLCNGTLYCNKATHHCATNPATVVHCPKVAGAPCLQAVCVAKTGGCVAQPLADGAACSDGDACTVGDVCDKGECTAGSNKVCPCTKDVDCGKFEDGNACNGTLFCDKTGPQPACAVNPKTVVSCATAGDTACATTVCAPASGVCHKLLRPVGAACDDGDPCTQADACHAKLAGAEVGLCVGVTVDCDDADACTVDSCAAQTQGCAHSAKDCTDTNPCTDDSCDAATGGCLQAPHIGPCDDGDACTFADRCENAICAGKKQLCDDANACTLDTCGGGACQHVPLPTGVCSDNDACTVDKCVAGKCTAAPLKDDACDDSKPCTIDSCHALAGCLNIVVAGLACDDGNKCTQPDRCQAGACVGLPAGATVCDDGKPCTTDTCDKSAGCQFAAASGACDDGDVCTGVGHCAGGSCLAGEALGCACQQAADCAGKEDGDACNGVLMCDKSAVPYRCRLDPKSVVDCSVGGACAAVACEPATGKCLTKTQPDGAACEVPGSKCTLASCKEGVCAAVGKITCDDKNPCTVDVCDEQAGCVHDTQQVDGKPCDDGDPCTEKSACKTGKCHGGAAKLCDDGNACTHDVCDASAGCSSLTAVLDGKPCDDLDKCTKGETCKTDSCAGGQPVSCDDGNPCTLDGCDAQKGCKTSAAAGPCDDGDKCTTGDACDAGTCAGSKTTCADNEPCTVDYCDANQGCVHDGAAFDGKPCVHPSGCVVGSFCNQAACVGGDASACSNIGDCKVQGDALFVVTGPAVGGAAVRFRSDGGAWAVSSTNIPPTWLTVRYDDFGAVKAMVKAGQGGKATSLFAVLPLADGGALIGGGINNLSPQHWRDWKTRLRRIDAAGKVVWTDLTGTANGEVRQIIKLANGNYALAANQDRNGAATFMVFTGAGKRIALRTYKGQQSTYYKDHYHLYRLIQRPGDGFYVLGRLANPSYDAGSGGHFLIAAFTSSAVRSWARYVKTGYQSAAFDAALGPNGQVVAVGYRQLSAGSAYVPWLARVSSSGAQQASQAALTTGASDRVLTSIVAQKDGGFAVASYGRPNATEGWSVELHRTTADFKTLWQRAWKPQTSTSTCVGCLAQVADGWRIGGTTSLTSPGGNIVSTLLIRADAWGNAPCTAVGACKGLKPADCDDNKACTFDLCDPKKGCEHSPIAGCP